MLKEETYVTYHQASGWNILSKGVTAKEQDHVTITRVITTN